MVGRNVFRFALVVARARRRSIRLGGTDQLHRQRHQRFQYPATNPECDDL